MQIRTIRDDDRTHDGLRESKAAVPRIIDLRNTTLSAVDGARVQSEAAVSFCFVGLLRRLCALAVLSSDRHAPLVVVFRLWVVLNSLGGARRLPVQRAQLGARHRYSCVQLQHRRAR